MLKKRGEKKLVNIVCMTKREILEIANNAVYNTTTIRTRDQNDGSSGGRRRRWRRRWWWLALTAASIRLGLVVGMRENGRILVAAQ